MKSLHELMLRETNYESVLHGPPPKNLHELLQLLTALDFVVKEWEEAMKEFDVENAEETAGEILTAIIGCRFSIVRYIESEDDDPMETSDPYIAAIKGIGRLKQVFGVLATSYAQTPLLSAWYGNLPEKVQTGFAVIRRKIDMDTNIKRSFEK